MGALRKESRLFEELDDMYSEKGRKDLSLDFYNECIDVSKKYTKREIKFILFKLRCLYTDVDTGIEKTTIIANNIKNILGCLAGKNLKISFICNVLEVALEELSDERSKQYDCIEESEL